MKLPVPILAMDMSTSMNTNTRKAMRMARMQPIRAMDSTDTVTITDIVTIMVSSRESRDGRCFRKQDDTEAV